MVNLPHSPTQAVVPNVRFWPNSELAKCGGCGRWACWSESLSLCRSRLIAFRWYLSYSNPYLLRRSLYPPLPRGGPYMFLSAKLRYHPIDSIDSSQCRWKIMFTHNVPLFLTLDFSICRCVVLDGSLMMYRNVFTRWF